jgi:kumamolisin
MALLVVPAMLMGQGSTQGRRAFADSIVPVGGGGERGTVVRTALTSEETQASMDFSVSLRMRNFDELEARIQAGDKISAAEMEARYLPLQSDYDRTAAWLVSEGFTLTTSDPNHTNLFARGTVAAVAKSFGVTFARVATDDGEFTSAVTIPSLPADVAEPILGIDGLQPHRQAHPPPRRGPKVTAVTSAGGGYFTPSDIAAAYQVPSSVTGAGQTIAIIMAATVQNSDLSTFWSTTGLAQTTANFTEITLNGGPTRSSQSNDAAEAVLDVEWAGGMAPGAKIRLYSIPDLGNNSILAACSQILSDAKSDPTLRVVSMSFGGTEDGNNSLIQEFAQMMAAEPGMTLCAASGDGGSNPSTTTGYYNASSPLSVSYPASDPNVTGVGGTTIGFDSNYNDVSEVTWFESSPPPAAASGGGFSAIISRPSYQAGTGVPSGNARCVPDVSAVSDGSMNGSQFGAFTVLNGQTAGAGGTSLATQVFAGLLAIVNQARTSAGKTTLGLLGPSIYPLIGAGAFNDITTGNNGAYSAGVGYDLCTGIGSPKMANLILALNGILPPTISSQPQSTSTAVGGFFSFSVTATGGGTLSYQWYLNGSAIAGQTSATLLEGNATAGEAGSYTVVVSNAAGSVTSSAATLTVGTSSGAAPAPAAPAAGGGGAPSLWFYGALALLAAVRLARRRRNMAPV